MNNENRNPASIDRSNKAAYVADGGATSSHREPNWDLLIVEALHAFLRRRELGAKLHGRDNWKQGNAAFVEERKKHLFHHALMLVLGDTSDDHLGGILCNGSFLAYFEQHPPAMAPVAHEDTTTVTPSVDTQASVAVHLAEEAVHQRRVASVKGASAFAHGFPINTPHGYVGENKVAWEWGWKYAAAYCDPKHTMPYFAGKTPDAVLRKEHS